MLSCVPREYCVRVCGRTMMFVPPQVAQVGVESRSHDAPQVSHRMRMPASVASPVSFSASPQVVQVNAGVMKNRFLLIPGTGHDPTLT